MSSTVEVEEQADEPVDGRTARAMRTREAIGEATLALLIEGDYRPSAARIAERAGVSVRSVFQHFDDLETLYAAVGGRVAQQVAALISPISTDLVLSDRVVAFYRQRARVNETLTPILRAANMYAPASPTITSQFQVGHNAVTAQVADTFAPELVKVGESSLTLADALVATASWGVWNNLRNLTHRSFDEAARVTAHLGAALLGDAVGEPITAQVAAIMERP